MKLIHGIIPIEINATATPTPGMAKAIGKLREDSKHCSAWLRRTPRRFDPAPWQRGRGDADWGGVGSVD
jgi:hypothetical protein